MAEVELIELETIQKFSIATRGATAPREEVVEALRVDLDALTQGWGQSTRTSTEAEAQGSAQKATKKARRKRAIAKETTGARSDVRRRSEAS